MALLPGPKMVLLRSFPGVTRLSDPQSSVWLGGLGYGKCRQELSHSSQQNQWLQKSGYPCKVLCGPGPWNEVCHLLSISTAKAASGSPMLSVEATLLSGDGFFTSCLLVGPGDVFSLVHLTIKSPALRFHSDLWLMAETCRGFLPTCQGQEAPNVSFRNRPEMGKLCGPNSPFSVKPFGLFDHFITPWELEVLT